MTNHSSTDWKAYFLRFETLLVAVLLAEIIIFSRTAENFATTGNALEIIRLSVELGLLALVMTPIILTGGIDLSVGSLLGLCAISFGKLWRDRRAATRARGALHAAYRSSRRGIECAANYSAEIATPDCHPGLVFAVSRAGRGHHTRR